MFTKLLTFVSVYKKCFTKHMLENVTIRNEVQKNLSTVGNAAQNANIALTSIKHSQFCLVSFYKYFIY